MRGFGNGCLDTGRPVSIQKLVRLVFLFSSPSLLRSSLYAWGSFRTSNGIFGFSADQKTGTIIQIQDRPVLVEALKDKHIVDVDAGVNHFVAIEDTGRLFVIP